MPVSFTLGRTFHATAARMLMKTILIFALVLFVLAIVALLILKKLGLLAGGTGPWPFYIKKPLSQPEQVLYHRLIRALPEHIVLAQVQVSRVLGVKKGSNFNEWNNRINRLSYDFVICGKDSAVIAAVELDDKSHNSSKRMSTDAKKDKASHDAGLRLIRWNVRSLPSEEIIRAELITPVAISGASNKQPKGSAGASAA